MAQNVAYVSAGRRIFDNNLILVLNMALPTMSLAEVRAHLFELINRVQAQNTIA